MENNLNKLVKPIMSRITLNIIPKIWFFGSILLLMPSSLLLAGPQVDTIVNGGAGDTITFPQVTSHATFETKITQVTPSLVIDWAEFNVPAGELVTFTQPNTSSVLLNRVTGNSFSNILGTINADGRIILSNPNGVLFGSSARVNVGGLLATGLTISDSEMANFQNGQPFALSSLDDNDYVTNAGILTTNNDGSYINLVSSTVNNGNVGEIFANLGEINLLSGKTVTVDFAGDGLMQFQLTAPVPPANNSGATSAVDNAGLITANSGKVVMQASVAQGIFTNAVNNSGVISATKISNVGGVIRLIGSGGLTANSGSISATGGGDVLLESTSVTELRGSALIDVSNASGVGGSVKLLGSNVGLLDSSSINADGSSGGGVIRVGDALNSSGILQTADHIIVDTNATIDANALDNGDGGSVTLRAEKATQVLGVISARGGSTAGNGGAIETSGKTFVEIATAPDVGSTTGTNGTWLLDQSSISIDNDATVPSLWVNYTPDFTIASTSFYAGTLATALDDGTSVTIKAATGDISIDTLISVQPNSNNNPNTSLKLEATGNIILNNTSAIVASGVNNKLNVDLNAGNNINFTGAAATAVDTNGGNFSATLTGSFIAANTVVTNGGNFDVTSGVDITLPNNISTNGGDININSTSVVNNSSVLDSGNGVISLQSVKAASANSGNLILTAGSGAISLNGDVGSSQAPLNQFTINSGTVSTTNSIFANTISQKAGNGIYANLNAKSGGIDLTGGSFTLNGLTTTSASGQLIINTSGTLNIDGLVSIDGAFTQTGTGLTTLKNDITTTNDAISFDNLKVEGSVSLDSGGGDITLPTIQVANADLDSLTLSAGTGSINLNGDVASDAEPLNQFTVNSGNVSTTNAIYANTISQLAGNGVYAGLTAKAGGIGLTGTSFTLNGLTTTTLGGLLSISNSGALNINGAVNIDGAFSQTGTGLTTLSNSITTSDDSIAFNNLTIDGSGLLDTGAGNADITLPTVQAKNSGLDNLTLAADSGNINLNGDVASLLKPLNSFTVISGNVSTTNNIFANTISQNAGNGVYANLNASLGGIQLTGNSFTLNGLTTTTSGGLLSINNSGALNINGAVNVDGAFVQTGAGVTSLGGDITTNEGIDFKSDIILVGNRRLKSLSGGVIKLLGDVNGVVNNIELDTAGDIYLAGVNAKSLTLASGKDLFLSSDILLDNTSSLSFQSVNKINLMSNVKLSAASIDFDSANIISGANNLELNADSVELFQVGGTGYINPTGLKVTGLTTTPSILNLSRSIDVDGDIDFKNVSTNINASLRITSAGSNSGLSLAKVDGNLQELFISNSGETRLHDDITLKTVDFSQATGGILLMNDILITTESSGSSNFSNTAIRGVGKSLTIAANSGDLLLNDVGADGSPLNALTIQSAGDVTLSGGIYTTSGLDFKNSLGSLNLNDSVVLKTDTGDISIMNTVSGGTDFTIDATTGSVFVSAITNVAALNIEADGAVNLNGDISAKSVVLQNNGGDINLQKSLLVDTSAANGNINLQNANIAGGNNSLGLNAGNGLISLGSIGKNNNPLNGLILTKASALAMNGDLFIKGGFDASQTGAVSLLNDVQINTSTDGGSVSFENVAINGAKKLNINAGSGSIRLASVGDVSGSALTGLTLATTSNVQIGGTYNVDGDFLINNASNVALTNDVVIDTTNESSDGTVNFGSSAIDGDFDLSISSGQGFVQLGLVGQNTNLKSLLVDSAQTTTGSVSTRFSQTYLGDLNVGGDLTVSEAGGIKINKNVALISKSNFEATSDILISGTVDGTSALSLTSSGGDVIVNGDIGAIAPLESLEANAKTIKVASITTEKDINLTAKDSVEQNGTLSSVSGSISIVADTGGITMAENTSSNVASVQSIRYLSNTDLEVTQLNGGDVSLTSMAGAIQGAVVDGKHIIGNVVKLSSANGINGVDVSGNAEGLKIVARNLDVESAKNDVLLTTESRDFDRIRPENNPLLMGAVAVKAGNFQQIHTGALNMDGVLDVAGNIVIDTTSRLTISNTFTADKNITISVGEDTVTTGLDGLLLTAKMESAQGGISLDINDLVDLKGEVSALGGDISVISDTSDVRIQRINAGSNLVTVKAENNIIAQASGVDHVVAGNVTLETRGRGVVGSFAKPIELSVSQTNLVTSRAFITGGTGTVVNTIGIFIDPGVAVNSGNKGQSTSAQEFSFVDATVFSQELNLFDVVNEGIRLPDDQLEDE